MAKSPLIAVGLLCTTLCAFGQISSLPKLEVASVKEYVPPRPDFLGLITECGQGRDFKFSGNRASVTHVTICGLIKLAYGLQDYQLIAPKWTMQDAPIYYEVQALAEGPEILTRERATALLQVVLAERFQLTVHKEMREMPIYALVIGKDGFKPAENKTANCPTNNDVVRYMISSGIPSGTPGEVGGMITVCKPLFPMTDLARVLTGILDRPVIDKTELKEAYFFRLGWETPSALFSAVKEQLGLQLIARREPVEVLIVDRVEKPAN